MPPIWTFTDHETGALTVREMTPDEWAAFPVNDNEIVTNPPDAPA